MGLFQDAGGRLLVAAGRPVFVRPSVDVTLSGIVLAACSVCTVGIPATSGWKQDFSIVGSVDGTFTVDLLACVNKSSLNYTDTFTGAITTTGYSGTGGTCGGAPASSSTNLRIVLSFVSASTILFQVDTHVDGTTDVSKRILIFRRLIDVCTLTRPITLSSELSAHGCGPSNSTTGGHSGAATFCL